MSIDKAARCGNTGPRLRKESSEQTQASPEHSADQPFDLSEEQQAALDRIAAWLRDNGLKVFNLIGHAGVGKSLIASRVPALHRGPTQFVGPSAKSASVLRGLGCGNAVTIHSAIYYPPEKEIDDDYEWELRRDTYYDLVVADECSMVGNGLFSHLMEKSRKILAIQDPNQLPPVRDQIRIAVPDVMLTEVHRQALESPIIRLATEIRQGYQPEPVAYDFDRLLQADVVLCALNDTRRYLNWEIRKSRFPGIQTVAPVIGERVVCYRNNYPRGLLNGVQYTVTDVVDSEYEHFVWMQLRDDDGKRFQAHAPIVGFYRTLQTQDVPHDIDLFDFGYCLTAHKSQGGEWNNVVVIDESTHGGFHWIAGKAGLPAKEFKRRWLYTAVTRAIDTLVIMVPPDDHD